MSAFLEEAYTCRSAAANRECYGICARLQAFTQRLILPSCAALLCETTREYKLHLCTVAFAALQWQIVGTSRC
jgi:hypothetical protein